MSDGRDSIVHSSVIVAKIKKKINKKTSFSFSITYISTCMFKSTNRSIENEKLVFIFTSVEF